MFVVILFAILKSFYERVVIIYRMRACGFSSRTGIVSFKSLLCQKSGAITVDFRALEHKLICLDQKDLSKILFSPVTNSPF